MLLNKASLKAATGEWEKDEELRQEILYHIEESEKASNEVMHLVDEMIEEQYQQVV